MMVRVIMGMIMGVVVAMIMMMVVVVMMVVVMTMIVVVASGHRGADRRRQRLMPQGAPSGEEPASLAPQQPRPDGGDQPVAGDLDDPVGRAHGPAAGPEQRRRDADDRHGDERLQQRRGERQHDPAPPGFLVGDQVGRDHRLAVARPGGVEMP